MKFIKITSQLPPFGKRVLFRVTQTWRMKKFFKFFDDELTPEEEILEYGQSAYILKDNSDYLVSQHPNINEVCEDFVTHWAELPIDEEFS